MRRAVLAVMLALVLPAVVAGVQVARALRQGALARPIIGALATRTPHAREAIHPGSCAFEPQAAGADKAVEALERRGGDALAFAAKHPEWLQWKALELENALHGADSEAGRLGELWSAATPLQRWALERGPLPEDLGSVDPRLARPRPLPRPEAQPEAAVAAALISDIPEDFAGFFSDALGPRAQRALERRAVGAELQTSNALLRFAATLDEAVRETGRLSRQAPEATGEPGAEGVLFLFAAPNAGAVVLRPWSELDPAVVASLRNAHLAPLAHAAGAKGAGEAPVPMLAASDEDLIVHWTEGAAFGTGTISAARRGSPALVSSRAFTLSDAAWQALYREGLRSGALDDDPRLRVGPARQTTQAWARSLRPELAAVVERALHRPASRARQEPGGDLWVEKWPPAPQLRGSVATVRDWAIRFERVMVDGFKARGDNAFRNSLPKRDGVEETFSTDPQIRLQWHVSPDEVTIALFETNTLLHARYVFADSSWLARYWLALVGGTPDDVHALAQRHAKEIAGLSPEFQVLARRQEGLGTAGQRFGGNPTQLMKQMQQQAGGRRR